MSADWHSNIAVLTHTYGESASAPTAEDDYDGDGIRSLRLGMIGGLLLTAAAIYANVGNEGRYPCNHSGVK